MFSVMWELKFYLHVIHMNFMLQWAKLISTFSMGISLYGLGDDESTELTESEYCSGPFENWPINRRLLFPPQPPPPELTLSVSDFKVLCYFRIKLCYNILPQ